MLVTMQPKPTILYMLREVKKSRRDVYGREDADIQKARLIKKVITDVTGITWVSICGRSRKKAVSLARHLYCAFAYGYAKMTLEHIGFMLADRDHTTVINSVNVVMDLLDVSDADVTQLANKIYERLAHEIKIIAA